MNIIILMGPPGAGKGTCAPRIEELTGFKHVSTGNLFRTEKASGSSLGMLFNYYQEQGVLIPDEISDPFVFSRIQHLRNVILDGHPRTVEQAKSLIEKFGEKNILHIVHVDTSDDVVIRRLEGRRICSVCFESYHVDFKPPTDTGCCRSCGSPVISHSDDSIEKIKNRLEDYHNLTVPALEYLKSLKIPVLDYYNSIFPCTDK